MKNERLAAHSQKKPLALKFKVRQKYFVGGPTGDLICSLFFLTS